MPTIQVSKNVDSIEELANLCKPFEQTGRGTINSLINLLRGNAWKLVVGRTSEYGEDPAYSHYAGCVGDTLYVSPIAGLLCCFGDAWRSYISQSGWNHCSVNSTIWPPSFIETYAGVPQSFLAFVHNYWANKVAQGWEGLDHRISSANRSTIAMLQAVLDNSVVKLDNEYFSLDQYDDSLKIATPPTNVPFYSSTSSC